MHMEKITIDASTLYRRDPKVRLNEQCRISQLPHLENSSSGFLHSLSPKDQKAKKPRKDPLLRISNFG